MQPFNADLFTEVATFASDSKKDLLGKDDVSGSGFYFDKDCFSQVHVLGQFNLGYFFTGLEVRTGDDPQAVHGLRLFIVDQHASDEKFRFEGLNQESRVVRQPLFSVFRLRGHVNVGRTQPPPPPLSCVRFKHKRSSGLWCGRLCQFRSVHQRKGRIPAQWGMRLCHSGMPLLLPFPFRGAWLHGAACKAPVRGKIPHRAARGSGEVVRRSPSRWRCSRTLSLARSCSRSTDPT